MARWKVPIVLEGRVSRSVNRSIEDKTRCELHSRSRMAHLGSTSYQPLSCPGEGGQPQPGLTGQRWRVAIPATTWAQAVQSSGSATDLIAKTDARSAYQTSPSASNERGSRFGNSEFKFLLLILHQTGQQIGLRFMICLCVIHDSC